MIYAPVASSDSIRVMLNTASMQGFYIDVMDVNNAFLVPELEEEIYIEIPDHFDMIHPDVPEGSVLRLDKALYGLKQSPAVFNAHIHRRLTNELGFQRSSRDPCVYTRVEFDVDEKPISVSMISLYVDDLIICIRRENVMMDFIMAAL